MTPNHILSTHFFLVLAYTGFSQKAGHPTIIEDKVHFSQTFDEERNYRVFLPPDYYTSEDETYPVIYYFHGFAGRFNGPAEGEHSVSAEVRYYDEFNGNIGRSGPDSLDNIAEFVKNHDVIVAKWDGLVEEFYPRPYDIGPVQRDIHFTNYFLEFVREIDSKYKTIPQREYRAVSGLSMGGFMSFFIASKFPHLIGSASAFCPSAAFTVGLKESQIYMPLKYIGRSFIGLPVRIHIASNDFLRQYHYKLDDVYRNMDLYYESWQYGLNYYGGFHNAANFEGMFGFHMKHFKRPQPLSEKWHHVDVFPGFNVWGYTIVSNRKTPGVTVLEEANEKGFRISTNRWLPDGPAVDDITVQIETDSIYEPDSTYQLITLISPDHKVEKRTIKAGQDGRLRISADGYPTDIGIYQNNGPANISMADYHISNKTPQYLEEFTFTPLLFNKGGSSSDSIRVEIISKNTEVEILDEAKTIGQMKIGSIHKETSFRLRSLNHNLRKADLKLVVEYKDQKEEFWIEAWFYSASEELSNYQISDGQFFKQEKSPKDESVFGKGNGNGRAEPGEKISIMTQSDFKENDIWYGLKLYTDDPYVDSHKSNMKYNARNDWSGGMRATSEIYISSDCPPGHTIRFYGEYDMPHNGDIRRDNQGAHSFITKTRYVYFEVEESE